MSRLRRIEAIVMFVVGLMMATLCASMARLPLPQQPSISASHLMEISGPFVIGLSGLLALSGSTATLVSWWRPLFRDREREWRRTSWDVREWSYGLAVCAFGPIVVFMVTMAVVGVFQNRIPGALETPVSTSWLVINLAATALIVAIGIIAARGWTYSQTTIDRASGDVGIRRRTWPFRLSVNSLGPAAKFAVLSRQELKGQEFFDRVYDRAWLVLVARDGIAPLFQTYCDTELPALRGVAAAWNEKLGLAMVGARILEKHHE